MSHESPAPHTASVLIVDDSKLNRHALSDLLRNEGHRVIAERNGRDALELLRKRDFDLVLLDIVMPEMDGYQALEQIMADKALRDIPVIMITGVDELQSAARCIEMGAEDYLLKPFEPALLKARIDALLEKRRLREREKAYLERLARENKRKSEELDSARTMQLSMLPDKPPASERLDIAARQISASEVGGDYYDFYPLIDDAILVAVGDAAGHGVSAGLMVAMTKALLLALDETHPKKLMTSLNGVMKKLGLDVQNNIALLLLKFVPHETGVLVRASGGGMPPVYILRKNGVLEQIQICGLPLGMVVFRADIEYEDVTFELDAGDTVMLVSDGLPEMFNPEDEILDYPRLDSMIGKLDPCMSAEETLNALFNIGLEWASGRPVRDDMTVVVVKVRT